MTVADRFEVRWLGDGLCLTRAGGALIAVMASPTTARQIDRIAGELERSDAGATHRPLALVVLRTGVFAAPPEPKVRERVEGMLRVHPPHAAAIVVEGEGLRAGAVRLALSAILRVSRASFPRRSFAQAREAARWLADARSPRLAEDEGAIIEAVEAARLLLDSEAAANG